MKQWYVKELSNLTNISVQTLHHYDRINLLKPSIRLTNGYRLYSEADLLKLQQVLALKFFGFELAQVKTLLSTEVDIVEHLTVQSQLLAEKARTMLEASQTLKNILASCNDDNSIPWETVIKLIEVYRMTQQLENTWAGNALNQEELKQYAKFMQEIKATSTTEKSDIFAHNWNDLAKKVNANIKCDPMSSIGIEIGKQCMGLVSEYYGKEYYALRNAIWRKGYKGGHLNANGDLTAEAITWLDKAIRAYYRDRIYSVLNQVDIAKNAQITQQWTELLIDLRGDPKAVDTEFYESLLNDGNINKAAKEWLKKYLQGKQHAK